MVTMLKLMGPIEHDLYLFETNHENILSMQECIYHDGSIFCVYNFTLERTLGDICSSPVSLEEPCLAAIFQEVLNALLFTEAELKIRCGCLDMDHVVLDKKAGKTETGKVKLILANKASTASTNAQALGYLMRQVMERESGVQQVQTVTLRRPELWSSDAQEFLGSTQTKSCSQLIEVRPKYYFTVGE
jgi:hypothetical protein